MSELREALAEEYPDWHPDVQKLVQAHVAKLEAALREINMKPYRAEEVTARLLTNKEAE